MTERRQQGRTNVSKRKEKNGNYRGKTEDESEGSSFFLNARNIKFNKKILKYTKHYLSKNNQGSIEIQQISKNKCKDFS